MNTKPLDIITVEPLGSASKCEKWVCLELYPQVIGPKIVKAYVRLSDIEGIFLKDNEILLRVKELAGVSGFKDYKIRETDGNGDILKGMNANDIIDELLKQLAVSDVVKVPLMIVGKSGTTRHLRIEN